MVSGKRNCRGPRRSAHLCGVARRTASPTAAAMQPVTAGTPAQFVLDKRTESIRRATLKARAEAKKHVFAEFLLGFKRATAQQDLNMVSSTDEAHLYQVVPIFLSKGTESAHTVGKSDFTLGVDEANDKRTCASIFEVLFMESGGTLTEDGHLPPDASLDAGQLIRAMRHLGHSINRERAEHMIREEDADGDGESRSSRASHSGHRRCRRLSWWRSCCPYRPPARAAPAPAAIPVPLPTHPHPPPSAITASASLLSAHANQPRRIAQGNLTRRSFTVR